MYKMSGKKKNKPKSAVEIFQSFRGDWGNIKPITRVIPNKKKNQKPKHRGNWEEN